MTAALVLPGPVCSALTAAARLGGRPGRVLLHSGGDADGVGRWSFVSAEPSAQVLAPAGQGAAALGALDAAVARAQAWADVALPVTVGAPWPLVIGGVSYDLGRALEPRAQAQGGAPPPDTFGTPDLAFGVYDAVWRRDEHSGACEVVGTPAAARALHAALSTPRALPAVPALGALEATEPDARHLAAVARVLEYLRAGDVYQVNVARWLRARVGEGDLVGLLARAQGGAPAPYGAHVTLGALELLAASPELFVRRAPGAALVETRPIKGTAPRGASPAVDAAAAASLRADPKELAEHLMIVDLLRNDLGRLAAIGTVRVDDFARVVSLPTVHHLVSTVWARWPETLAPSALLAAMFPGGSITGAPKVRAMQIIDELEPRRRGPYTGCVGYFGAHGAVDLAITIRSLVRAGDALWLAVGGGVVADSTPARELAETEAKAAAWRRVIG